jgi:hypothetical protein
MIYSVMIALYTPRYANYYEFYCTPQSHQVKGTLCMSTVVFMTATTEIYLLCLELVAESR